MATLSTPLRELLIREGLVTASQVEDALGVMKSRGTKLSETLVDIGYLTASDLENFIVRLPGVVGIDLSQRKAVAELCDLIPEELAQTCNPLYVFQTVSVERVRGFISSDVF